MKKLLTITLISILSLSLSNVMAQEMKYLIGGEGKDVSVSGFGAVFNEFSAVDKDFAFLMGGGAAVLIDQRFFFGGYGMGLTTRHLRSFDRYDYNTKENYYSEDLYTRFGHGGFWLGYIHNPKKAIHWGVNAKIGWGAVTLSDKTYSDVNYYTWDNYNSDHVFVLTPQVDLGMNMLKWFRINVGVGYRFVSGIEDTYAYQEPNGEIVQKEFFDSNAFSNFTGNVTLAFGWFNN